MNHDEPTDPLQQRIALLALAATRPANDAGTCPGDARLAAFIERRLSGSAREAMLYHLNRCPTCYQVWLDTVEDLQDEGPTPVRRPEVSQTPNGWQRLLALTDWRLRLAIPAIAAAALAGTLLLRPWTPAVTRQIDAQYQALHSRPDAGLTTLVESELPLPWESAALGFSAGRPSPLQRAFGAGLWVGRAALMDKNTDVALPDFLKPTSASLWSDSEWATEYHAGRWIALLWALAQSDRPDANWSAQREILDRIKRQLGARGADPSARRETELLTSLEPLLASLANQDNVAQRATLGRRLETLMQQLMFPPF